MYKKIIVLSFIVIILFSCSNAPKSEKIVLIDSIVTLEQQCYDDNTNTYNHKVALKTLNKYQEFINKYPRDTSTADYLYLSGQLSKSIDLYGEAIHQFEILLKDFPNYDKASNAKFLIGMIYENDIKDTNNAKQSYQEFIKEYPQDALVDDAQFLLQNLSLTDDQLIQMLESKSKEDSLM